MRERAGLRATLCFLGLIGVLAVGLAGCSTSPSGNTTITGGTDTSTTGGTEANTAPSSGCQPGITKISDSIALDQHCGPAKAHTNINGQKVNWSNGDCVKGESGFNLNIGRAVLGANGAGQEYKKQSDFLTIGVQGASDGKYTTNAYIIFDYQGQDYNIGPYTLTLSGELTQGTFSGTDQQGASVSGSFTC